MDRHGQQQITQRGRPVSAVDAAHANEYFEHFVNATSLRNILGYYRSICDLLHLRPNTFPLFYPKLRANLNSWRAKAVWKKFDARATHKCYGKGRIAANTRVLIIGAGPCGLRTAIEAQLLGAKVVVVEKRDRLSRNNVLHLWPFVIEDLRNLGAKKFFGKFCAGAIDHISIRQLQCVLLKVALLLGVEIHTEVSFEQLIEPTGEDKIGWRAEFKPANHPVSQYEFDVIIGADGKRNTLQGFKRKEFRGKLAIAITANFINKKTEAEAIVEEISGVAFIFNQKFFKDLYEQTGIDLENIVYYKDDTHYFVMTAKKTSLLEKGVILQDLADTERLLAPDNVNREALLNYAREAADFSTKYQLPDMEFAVNHYGLPDVAMFDFTSMYAAENASKVIERHGYRLLMVLVGDSLLEPFWPTGSGCARGFLSSMDAAWAIRSWASSSVTPLEVLAERESIYRLLAQTTPDNLNKDWKAYTLDPTTRYPNLNKNVLMAHQVISLCDTDNPKSIEEMRLNSTAAVRTEMPKKRRRANVDNEVLINWVSEQIREHEDIQLTDIASIFRDGKVLCAIINHYRPDLLDYSAIKDELAVKNNQLAIDLLEKELGVPPIMTGEEITNTEDYLSMATYLTQIYDTFRCEIPHIKHPKLKQNGNSENFKSLKQPEILDPSSDSKSSLVTIYNRKKSKQIPLKELDNSMIVDAISKKVAQNFEKKLLAVSSTRLLDKNKNMVLTVKNSKKAIKRYTAEIIESLSKENSDYSEYIPTKDESPVKDNPDRGNVVYFDENFNEIYPDFMSNITSVTNSVVNLAMMNYKVPQESDSSPIYALQTTVKKKHKNEGSSKLPTIRSNRNLVRNRRTVDTVTTRGGSVYIRVVEKKSGHNYIVQNIKFDSNSNCLTISSKAALNPVAPEESSRCDREKSKKLRQTNHNKSPKIKCKIRINGIFKYVKFSSLCNMSDIDKEQDLLAENIYSRVSDWISSHDFFNSEIEKRTDPEENASFISDVVSDITSITACLEKQKASKETYETESKEIIEAEPVKEIKNEKQSGRSDSEDSFANFMRKMSGCKVIRTLSKFSQYSPFQKVPDKQPASTQFSVILEGEEELPESKQSTTSFKTVKQYPSQFALPPTTYTAQQPARPSSRHKRHAEPFPPNKIGSMDRKHARKRRTLEKVGASVMLSFFLHAVLESSIVAFVLFILDVIVNSENYGIKNPLLYILPKY